MNNPMKYTDPSGYVSGDVLPQSSNFSAFDRINKQLMFESYDYYNGLYGRGDYALTGGAGLKLVYNGASAMGVYDPLYDNGTSFYGPNSSGTSEVHTTNDVGGGIGFVNQYNKDVDNYIKKKDEENKIQEEFIKNQNIITDGMLASLDNCPPPKKGQGQGAACVKSGFCGQCHNPESPQFNSPDLVQARKDAVLVQIWPGFMSGGFTCFLQNGTSLTYLSRVEDATDLYHNFPRALDQAIIQNGAWSQRIKDAENWYEIQGPRYGSFR